jgi:hypothetical protein
MVKILAVFLVLAPTLALGSSENDRFPMTEYHSYLEFEAAGSSRDWQNPIVTLGASGCIHGPFEVFDQLGKSVFRLGYGEDIPTRCSEIGQR